MAMRRPRISWSSRSGRPTRSLPSNSATPRIDDNTDAGMKRNRPRRNSDLPQPVSPTMATRSPGAMSIDTPSTGLMVPEGARKLTTRSRTASEPPPAPAAATATLRSDMAGDRTQVLVDAVAEEVDAEHHEEDH